MNKAINCLYKSSKLLMKKKRFVVNEKSDRFFNEKNGKLFMK